MSDTEVKFFSKLTEDDLLCAGLPVDRFRREVANIGLRVKDGFVNSEQNEWWVVPNRQVRDDLLLIQSRHMKAVNLLGEYGNERSLMGEIENTLTPLAYAELSKSDGDEFEDDRALIEDEGDLYQVDGDNEGEREGLEVFQDRVKHAMRVGVMALLVESSDELVEASSKSQVSDAYRDYQSALTFYRAGEVLVKVNGLRIADFFSGRGREKLGILDQYKMLMSMMAGDGPDPEQSDLAAKYPTLARAHFNVAAQVMKVLLDPPVTELRQELVRLNAASTSTMSAAGARFQSAASHVDAVRRTLQQTLVAQDPNSVGIREAILADLNGDETRKASAVKILRLDQAGSLWNLYRSSAGQGDIVAVEVLGAQAARLPERPFLIKADLPVIYDPTLEDDEMEDITVDQLQKVAKGTKLYSQREFEFEGDQLIQSDFDYGQLKVPDKVSVQFDKHHSQRKFRLALSYNGPDGRVLDHSMSFDLQKGGLQDWNFIEPVSDPEMLGVQRSSLTLTYSVLQAIQEACEVRVKEREALKATVTIKEPTSAAKKGPYVPSPKFDRPKSDKPKSILAEPITVNGNDRGQVRDVILIPKGDKWEKLMEDLQGHPESVRSTVQQEMRDFNKDGVQRGLEPLKGNQGAYRWRCKTEIGQIRALMEPAGTTITERGRFRFWRPALVLRRAGFYTRLRQMGYKTTPKET